MESAQEAVLIERCRSKDAEAFRELVEGYKEQAYGFAFSYLRNSEEALNISQDAFVRAWQFIGTFQAGRSFRSWLLGIVRHLSLNRLRRKRILREISLENAITESGFDPADSKPDPQEVLEGAETRRMVWKAIMGLKEEFREVIVLKHFHDMSYHEIAESLMVPDGTVMSRLYYARLALKKQLEPMLQER